MIRRLLQAVAVALLLVQSVAVAATPPRSGITYAGADVRAFLIASPAVGPGPDDFKGKMNVFPSAPAFHSSNNPRADVNSFNVL